MAHAIGLELLRRRSLLVDILARSGTEGCVDLRRCAAIDRIQ